MRPSLSWSSTACLWVLLLLFSFSPQCSNNTASSSQGKIPGMLWPQGLCTSCFLLCTVLVPENDTLPPFSSLLKCCLLSEALPSHLIFSFSFCSPVFLSSFPASFSDWHLPLSSILPILCFFLCRLCPPLECRPNGDSGLCLFLIALSPVFREGPGAQ